jgi:hypothetical protein
MGTLFLTVATQEVIVALTVLSEFNFNLSTVLTECLLAPLVSAFSVMVWWIWFGRPKPAWLPYAVAALTILLSLSLALGNNLFLGLVPQSVEAAFRTVSLGLRILLFLLTIRVVIQGILSQALEGWLVLPAVLLGGISAFQLELTLLRVRISLHFFGMHLSVVEIARLAFVAVVALLLLRRLLRSVRRQRQMALDVKQAQEVQQVILPEHRVVLPGLEIESEYRPALEVGGDFFQIIPHPTDGSLLIVAGDVAGKGLTAGMLVALLVGAIRTVAEIDTDPSFILAALNRRLLGRGDARATCLSLRIAADGTVTLANAGHLPPYLNGVPLEIEGSLPLGILDQLDCSHQVFRMAENDCLLVLSDGVAEATDVRGNLFGFDRVLELARTHPSAAQIADTAQSFGQEDDISVISITRIAVAKLALARG